jgi:outer membrane receptor protein involved in Fe transport
MTTILMRVRQATFGTLLLLLAAPAAAQQVSQVSAAPVGRVVGRVVDGASGVALSNVSISVLDHDAGTLSGIDGRFTIVNVPAGTVTLRVETLGYGPKQIAGVEVPAGSVVEQNVTLDPQAVQLTAINVTAAAEKGSVLRALETQRNAASIVSAVTAEQISRSPDGDAAAAMQRVSGVTVHDGKYVHVRGLGERYTTTSLNGARIPSPEPERKLVPLDLFPSGLLQDITTSKTFTPDLPGDFSGAQVNIRTREFPAHRQLSFSASAGMNDRAVGQPLPAAPREGAEWLGFAGIARELPQSLRGAGDFQGPVTQEQMNGFVNDMRNTWSALERDGSPNGSLSFNLGGTDPLFGQDFSYLLSGTYGYAQEVQADQRRAHALAGAEPGSTLESDLFTGTTGRTSVLWGGLANLATLVGSHTRFALNATFNRSAENEARVEAGRSENHGQLPMQITRLRFVERSVLSTQLKAEHELPARQRAEWSLSWSNVARNEPDRSEFVQARFPDADGNPGAPAWFSAASEGAVRTYGELAEQSMEGTLNYRIAFGDVATPHLLRSGLLYRTTARDARSDAYGISSTRLDGGARMLTPEEIFNGQYSTPGSEVFWVTPLAQGGAYTAEDRLLAGYAMGEVALGDRLRIVAGARVERSEVDVAAQPTIGPLYTAALDYTDVLPALSATYRLTDAQNLRFSATRTLARPEYREIAGIQYREVLGGDVVQGNPTLQRTLIDNVDARWEWYPAPGEALSVALFAKRFDDPIERIYLGTSGTRVVSFVNAAGAHNYGAELEVRKRLGAVSDALTPFTAFTNVTLMESQIELPRGGASQVNEKRAMVGQAPYVVNAGLTWAPEEGSTSATLLYNVAGRKIHSAAEAPLPEVYEEARHGLDLSLRIGLRENVSAKLDAKNLLDAPVELTQGDVTRDHYRTGRVFSLGVSWTQ